MWVSEMNVTDITLRYKCELTDITFKHKFADISFWDKYYWYNSL